MGVKGTMRRTLIIACSLALAAQSAAALAQLLPGDPGAGAPRADFAALDRNRDGYLSKVEANGDREVAKRFAQFDLDKDGRLSLEEYVRAKDDNDKRIQRDAVITARVKAALLAEKGIPSMSISVDTYEGSVRLGGFVGSPDLASKAGRVTAAVSGVRTVDNNISVK